MENKKTKKQKDLRKSRNVIAFVFALASIATTNLVLANDEIFTGNNAREKVTSEASAESSILPIEQDTNAAATSSKQLIINNPPSSPSPKSSNNQSQSDESNKNSYEALPQLFVTADKTPNKIKDIGRSIAVISPQEIKERGAETVSEAIKTTTGLQVDDFGGKGAPGIASVRIRGLSSGYTKTLLDSFTLNDPTSPQGQYFPGMSYFNLAAIDHIEILKGSSGVLYGSQAAGGVINMITKRPIECSGLEATLKVEGGTNETYTESAYLGYGEKNIYANIAAGHYRTDGNLKGAESNGSSFLFEPYFILGDHVTLKPIVLYEEGKVTAQASPSYAGGGEWKYQVYDGKYHEFDYLLLGIDAGVKAGIWKGNLITSFAKSHRKQYVSWSDSYIKFNAESLNVDFKNTIAINSMNTIFIFGPEWKSEQAKIGETNKVKHEKSEGALYVHADTTLFDEVLSFGYGARVSKEYDIDEGGNESGTLPLLEASTAINIPETPVKLHASIAQGYRTPSLYETYYGDFNSWGDVTNPDLKEEKFLSWDTGVTLSFFEDKLLFDVTYFNIKKEDAIAYSWPTYINDDDYDYDGIEFSVEAKPTQRHFIRIGYTWQRNAETENVYGRDSQNDNRLIITPKHSGYITLGGSSLNNKLHYSLTETYRGSQFANQTIKEDAVYLTDAKISYDVAKNINLYVKANNIFDKEYTSGGWRMDGRTVFGGLEGRF